MAVERTQWLLLRAIRAGWAPVGKSVVQACLSCGRNVLLPKKAPPPPPPSWPACTVCVTEVGEIMLWNRGQEKSESPFYRPPSTDPPFPVGALLTWDWVKTSQWNGQAEDRQQPFTFFSPFEASEVLEIDKILQTTLQLRTNCAIMQLCKVWF